MPPHTNTPLRGAVPVQLTDLAIKSAKPPASGYVTLWDGTLKGFGCMIGHGGTRSFCVLVASGRRKVIGKYPLMALAQARQVAREMLAEKTLKKTVPKRHAFDDAKAEYLQELATRRKARTVQDYTRLLNRHFPFKRKNLVDLTGRDIAKALPPTTTPAERKYAFAVIKAFLRWCVRNRIIDRSPMETMQAPPPGKSRERVLAPYELRAILKAAWKGNEPFHKIVLLLAYSGQRRTEIAALQREWIEEDTINYPSWFVKNSNGHTVPISQTVKDILKGIEKVKDNPYYFPAARKRSEKTTVFNGWSKPKADFDKECGIRNWTLHDLRRTLSSNLAAMGVLETVTEKLLNHITGRTQSTVARTYNRYEYLPEMRDAVLKWEAHLNKLIDAQG